MNGWHSAIGWNQPAIASTGTKVLEMSGRRMGTRYTPDGKLIWAEPQLTPTP